MALRGAGSKAQVLPASKPVRHNWTHFVSPKLEARVRPEKGGYGLFALETVQPGELLVMWGGVVLPGEKLGELTPIARRHSIQVEDNLFLAPVEVPEPGDYVNHCCDPNAGLLGATGLVAMRMVMPGEEVCYDYAMSDGCQYDEFECSCHAIECRGRVSGNDWTVPALQERYSGYFSPYLQRRINAMKARTAHHRAGASFSRSLNV
jgi:SET domain-containing protein